jgi:hypothetical protein
VGAARIIEQHGDSRTAAKALKVLADKSSNLKEIAAESRRKSDTEDFTFTYEEEADPEVFFVPYLWEVIVCVVTSSTLEWNKERIQVFALLDDEEIPDDIPLNDANLAPQPPQQYSKDVSAVV